MFVLSHIVLSIISVISFISDIVKYRVEFYIVFNTMLDPFTYTFQQYEQIPVVSLAELQAIQKSKKIVLMGNFVVDITGFRHPGYNSLLHSFLNQNISTPYTKNNHSTNADLIICQRTIARLNNHVFEQQTKQFYTSTLKNQTVHAHSQIMKKFQPDRPLLQTVKKLSLDQFIVLTQVPKVFSKPEDIRFKSDKFQNFLFEERFWVSTTIFLLYLLSLLVWIFKEQQIETIIHNSLFFPLGLISWTGIEYYFHRFLLHPSKQKLKENYGERSHLIHHAFPNLNKKVSLSIVQNTIKFLAVFIVISFVFSKLVAATFFAGFLTAMIAYDCIHYYCHFGPELEIQWLKKRRINHLKHHYRSQSKNYGVTTNIWDKVFGTYECDTKKQ